MDMQRFIFIKVIHVTKHQTKRAIKLEFILRVRINECGFKFSVSIQNVNVIKWLHLTGYCISSEKRNRRKKLITKRKKKIYREKGKKEENNMLKQRSKIRLLLKKMIN